MVNKLLFKKIELWLVALLLLAMLLLMLLFGVSVRDRGAHLGVVGRVAFKIASFPADAVNAFRLLLGNNITGMVTEHSDRFPGKSGWTFFDVRLESGLDGYLFFSRYDGDVKHHVFELVDLKAGQTMYRIDLDSDKLLANARRDSRFASLSNWRPERFQAVHPLILESGDIIFKGFRTPLLRMNICGEPIWVQDAYIFHHTIEGGPDGNFWTATWVEPQRVEGLRAHFRDPGIVQFSENGKILYDRSLTDVMIKHGLAYLILGGKAPFSNDPLHLNDVQPVFEDGPYWKRGDLFLSLRHISTVMLFRPSTDKIIWWKQGPWVAQHDVDIINGTTISIFNNNAFDFGHGPIVDGHSQINYFDFSTGTVSSPFEDVLKRNDFKNEAAGLFTLMSDGHYYLDESESGRTLIFTPSGELAAEHVNRAKDGLIYHLGWSRYMDRASGNRFLAQNHAANCERATR